MAVAKFQDPQIERYFLAACLKGPNFWKDLPDEKWLDEPLHQKAYKEFKKFLSPPYLTFPTANLVIEKTDDNDIKLLVKELEVIDVTSGEVNVRMQDMFDMYCSRQVYDIAKKLPDELGKKNVAEIVKDKISMLSSLMNPLLLGSAGSEYIYESAIERWMHYKGVEEGSIESTAIPFHIQDLDKYTNGGLRKSHMMLVIAPTGSFKTLFKLSLAYNFAFVERRDTMVLTLEVPGSGDQRDYQMMLDARHSLLEFSDIINGKLGVNRSIYREKLKEMVIE